MAHISHHHHSPHGPDHGADLRRWEDWAPMALGILLAVSPWLLGYRGLEAATMNAVIIGLLIAALSALALTLLDRWEVYPTGLLGIWAALSPWLVGFSRYDVAMAVHLGVGAAVMVIAAVGIWRTSRGA